jgi:membrane protein DedA with SNARE-associated domain
MPPFRRHGSDSPGRRQQENVIEQFVEWVGGIGHWAYLAIFLVVSLESAAFLGFFMPGEALVFLGGFLASRGVLDVTLLIPLVAAAAILGDSIGYELGRLLQKPWFLHYGRWLGLNERGWKRLEDFSQRHGGKTIFLARFSAFFRILVPFFAGAVRMSYPHFLIFNVFGGVVWATGSVLIGFFAGESWRLVERWLGRGAMIAVLLVVGTFLAIKFIRREK